MSFLQRFRLRRAEQILQRGSVPCINCGYAIPLKRLWRLAYEHCENCGRRALGFITVVKK